MRLGRRRARRAPAPRPDSACSVRSARPAPISSSAGHWDCANWRPAPARRRARRAFGGAGRAGEARLRWRVLLFRFDLSFPWLFACFGASAFGGGVTTSRLACGIAGSGGSSAFSTGFPVRVRACSPAFPARLRLGLRLRFVLLGPGGNSLGVTAGATGTGASSIMITGAFATRSASSFQCASSARRRRRGTQRERKAGAPARHRPCGVTRSWRRPCRLPARPAPRADSRRSRNSFISVISSP